MTTGYRQTTKWVKLLSAHTTGGHAYWKAVGGLDHIGGPKGNGMLYVGYAIRRGWLAKQA